MKVARMLVLPLLLLGQAFAAEPPPDSAVLTEPGAETLLRRTIMKLEATVPALTPEEQRYVDRENAFADQMGKASSGSYSSGRVNAFLVSKPFYEWVVHRKLKELRHSLDTIDAFHASNQRFAVWVDVIISMSHVEAVERALAGLRQLGVISQTDLGDAEGANWLRGPLDGQVQLVWPSWSETMWIAWGHAGLGRAVGLTSKPP